MWPHLLEGALWQAGVVIVVGLQLGHVPLEHGDVLHQHGELGADLQRVTSHHQLLRVRLLCGQEGESGQGDLHLVQERQHLRHILF